MPVVEFPRRPSAPGAEERARQERDRDVSYAATALKATLPAAALQHLSGADLLLAASRALAAVDAARHERRRDPSYDAHLPSGQPNPELIALDRLFLGDEPPETGGAA